MTRNRVWLCSFVVLLALVLSSCGSPLRKVPVSDSTTVWSLSLREAGYPEDNFGNEPNDFAAPRQITFIDSGTLAVSFATSQYSPQGKLKYTAHVVLVDTGAGTVRNAKKWECRASCQPYVFANYKQKLLITERGSIGLYDTNLEVTRHLALQSGNRIVQISPDGRTLGREGGRPGGATLVFLDSDTFETTGVAFTSNVRTISNQEMANDVWPAGSRNAAIAIASPKSPEVVFRTTCREALPRFLSDETLLVTFCNQLSVITHQGRTLFSDRYPGQVRFAAVARNGNRFAVSVTTYRGWDPPVLDDELLIVYDLGTERPILTVRARPLPHMQSLAALSPDGLLFVVGSKGELRLYRLP